MLQGGEYSTFYGAFTFGGQVGRAIWARPTRTDGRRARLGYFFNFSGRRTHKRARTTPAGQSGSAQHGFPLSGFGNLTYQAGARDQISLTLNSAPAYTQIANRDGTAHRLSARRAGLRPVRGAQRGRHAPRCRHRSQPIPTSTPTRWARRLSNWLSQGAAGQDINQRDTNDFGLLSLRHTFSSTVTGLLSFGLVHSGQDIKNNNTRVEH